MRKRPRSAPEVVDDKKEPADDGGDVTRRHGVHPPTVLRALQLGLRQLSVSAVGELPCRDEQLKQVLGFLQETRANPTLQLYGMPGTGKTAVVRRAVAMLGPADYSCVFLNGYVMQRQSEAYSVLWRHLSEERLGKAEDATPEEAAAQLEKRFQNGWGKRPVSNKCCVVVVDEMDKVCEKNGKTFFKLVDWMTSPHARCKLVTMCNRMNLPDSIDAKTRSRFNAIERVVFDSYTAEQLMLILTNRVGDIAPRLFSASAMTYACKQIANVHGDVRRLLQLASSAVHNVLCAEKTPDRPDKTNPGIVQIRDMSEVFRSVFHDRFHEFISASRSPLLLAAVAVLTREAMTRVANNLPTSVPLVSWRTGVEHVVVRHAAALGYPSHLIGLLAHAADSGLGGELGLTSLVSARAWHYVVDTLRELRFIELCYEDGTPVEELATTDQYFSLRGAHAVLVQSLPSVKTQLEMHAELKEPLTHILNGR